MIQIIPKLLMSVSAHYYDLIPNIMSIYRSSGPTIQVILSKLHPKPTEHSCELLEPIHQPTEYDSTNPFPSYCQTHGNPSHSHASTHRCTYCP
jgi:hypothetical protein